MSSSPSVLSQMQHMCESGDVDFLCPHRRPVADAACIDHDVDFLSPFTSKRQREPAKNLVQPDFAVHRPAPQILVQPEIVAHRPPQLPGRRKHRKTRRGDDPDSRKFVLHMKMSKAREVKVAKACRHAKHHLANTVLEFADKANRSGLIARTARVDIVRGKRFWGQNGGILCSWWCAHRARRLRSRHKFPYLLPTIHVCQQGMSRKLWGATRSLCRILAKSWRKHTLTSKCICLRVSCPGARKHHHCLSSLEIAGTRPSKRSMCNCAAKAKRAVFPQEALAQL